MNLKEFVKNVLIDINSAVDEARGSTNRDLQFTENDSKRTIEFDVAVTAEDKDSKSGKAGIRVLSLAEGGGTLAKETKSSVVSRVVFGLRIHPLTRQEEANLKADAKQRNADRAPNVFGR